MQRPAASVIVPWGPRFIGITRGTDVANVCFPGGTGDQGDAGPRVTGARELREETGIVVLPADLEEILVRPDGGHVTYLARRVVQVPHVLHSNPFEGYVDAYPAEAFLAPSSRYRETAAEAFRRIGARQAPPRRNPLQDYERLRRSLLR
jgi:8-oxo-dGTP pyrophosphatase MutT (NUDIX family)